MFCLETTVVMVLGIKRLTCVVVFSDILATGSRDGHAMIWDSRTNPKGKFISELFSINNQFSGC